MKNYLKCNETFINETTVGRKNGCLSTGTPYDCLSITHRPRYIRSVVEKKQRLCGNHTYRKRSFAIM